LQYQEFGEGRTSGAYFAEAINARTYQKSKFNYNLNNPIKGNVELSRAPFTLILAWRSSY
jgi:hypothetical protein